MTFLQFGYYFPVSEQKNLLVKDDSSLYRFQVLLRHYQYHHNSAPYLNCHHHHSCAPNHHNCLYFLWHICHNLLLDCQCSHWSAPSTNNIRKQDWPDMVVHILLSIYNMNMKSKVKLLLQHVLPKDVFLFGLFCHESWWWLILFTVQRQMGQLFCYSPATEPLLHLSSSIFVNQWKPLMGLNQTSMFENEGLLTPSAGIA